MASVSRRLTQDNRHVIENKLVAGKFGDRIKALELAKHRIAIGIYDTKFTMSERSRMLALPTGWLPEVDTIYARLGGRDVHMGVMGMKLPVPYEYADRYGNSTILINMDSGPLVDKYNTMKREELSIEDETVALRRKIGNTLRAISTVKALLKIWPEIKSVVDEVCGADVVYLPARVNPDVKSLNEALGLKPVVAEKDVHQWENEGGPPVDKPH